MKITSPTLFCVTAALISPVFAAESWLVDLPVAQQQAQREQKLVLVDFTGSDWCTACIALRRNVLDTPDFRNWAEDKFVFVEIDLPQRKQLPGNRAERNRALAEHYGVAAFPTIMVLTPRGEVMGGFEGDVKTTKNAIVALEHAIEAADLSRKAALCDSTERAKILYSIYSHYPTGKSFERHATALRELTMKADPDNVTGIHHAAEAQEQARRFLAERNATPIQSPAMGRLLERQLREALPENRNAVLMERCQYALATAETLDDITAACKLFEELIPLLPAEEAADQRHFVETYFTDPAALLQMLKSSRPH